MKIKFQCSMFLILCLSGCSVYTHQPVDIPLISKKKDVRIDGGFSLKEAIYGTVSLGITNRIALQAYLNRSFDSRFYSQNAAGFYKDLGNNKILEVYSGFGFGKTETGNHDISTKLYGKYQLYFSQINFGKVECKFANLDFGIAVKIGFLHSNLMDMNYFDTIDRLYSGPYETFPLIVNTLLFEPVGFIKIGGERLKLSLNLGSCLNYQLTHKDKQLPIDKFNIGLGFNLNFGGRVN